MQVLIVDDSVSARFALKRSLERFGVAVEAASTAEDALALLGTMQFDAIFMDHVLPQMNGLQAVEAIRRMDAYQTTPVIMCSSNDDAAYIEQAMQAGANSVIRKPPEPEQLETVVAALRSGRMVPTLDEPQADFSSTQEFPAAAPEVLSAEPAEALGTAEDFGATVAAAPATVEFTMTPEPEPEPAPEPDLAIAAAEPEPLLEQDAVMASSSDAAEEQAYTVEESEPFSVEITAAGPESVEADIHAGDLESSEMAFTVSETPAADAEFSPSESEPLTLAEQTQEDAEEPDTTVLSTAGPVAEDISQHVPESHRVEVKVDTRELKKQVEQLSALASRLAALEPALARLEQLTDTIGRLETLDGVLNSLLETLPDRLAEATNAALAQRLQAAAAALAGTPPGDA